jgi:hypothetical protein
MTTTKDGQRTSSFAYCSWHQGYTRTARLVRIPADQGSGSGTPGLHACAPCRHAYDLEPISERP